MIISSSNVTVIKRKHDRIHFTNLMISTISQVQALIAPFANLRLNPHIQIQYNQPVQILAASWVNYEICPFKGNINSGKPQWLNCIFG